MNWGSYLPPGCSQRDIDNLVCECDRTPCECREPRCQGCGGRDWCICDADWEEDR